MPSYTSLLEEALEAWEYCRHGVIEELENLAEEELDFRPAPESRSVRELVQHIIETALMAAGELTRPDGDFRRQGFGEFIREYAGEVGSVTGKGELLELLRRTHREGDRQLREGGELRMLQFIHRFDGQPGTRLAWLHHCIEHEMYHRGQLALYARLLGRVPALTRQIG
jgi:uncharacterized damage-inducible protein DinB